MAETRPFQVDLKGVVDLLSRHIYSSPRVFIRELLQNGVDAITARRNLDQELGRASDPGWGITIYPIAGASQEFAVVDDGVGLSIDEVTDLLATVGRSSKRDILDLARSDFLGQFGIGLLSCFMVSERIRILSRSATGAEPVEWIGSGDGTFQVRPFPYDLPVGTQVFLGSRFDSGDLLTEPAVGRLAREYGQFLPVPITVVTSGAPLDPTGQYIPRPTPGTRINTAPVFLDPDAYPPALMDYATTELGFTPFDVIDLAAPGTGTAGKAFVLPYSPPPGAHQAARVYLGRMLLGTRVDDLLPDWAFFVRVVVNSTGLNPTASREGIVEDFNLEYTREQLGACVRRWLMDLALHHRAQWRGFLGIHEQAIKQLALHDEEMARIFVGWLTVETSAGPLTVSELVKRSPHVRYTRTLDEYRQVSALARDDSPLVNGGFVFDSDLMELLPSIYPSVEVTAVDVLTELDRLDPPGLTDRELTVRLEDRATAVLESRECQAVVRIMGREDAPALFVADPDVFRHIDRGRAGGASTGIWAEIMAQADAFALSVSSHAETGFASRLCLNWSNPLIRSLARLTDEAVFARSVQLLYVQSQLAGSYPLTAADRALMTTALSDLIALTTSIETLTEGDPDARWD